MALRAWMRSVRRRGGTQLLHMERRAKLFKSWYHQWSGSFKSQKGGGSRSHVLLYGAVAFVWERERISNEDVMSCVKEYAERIDRKLDQNGGMPPAESPSLPPTLHSSQTPSSTSQDSTPHNAWLFNWTYTPPHHSSTPSISADSARSTSTGGGLLSWFYSSGDPNSAIGDATNFSNERSTLSGRISSWFSKDTAAPGDPPGEHTHPRASGEGWGAWARGWFAAERSLADPNVTDTQGCSTSAETAETTVVPESPIDLERNKREEFVKECLRHYRAHRDECVSRRPLVGMAGAASPMRRGMLALEKMKKRTRTKMINILSHHQSYFAEEFDEFAECEDNGRFSSPLADLACIGMDCDTELYCTSPGVSLRTDDWVGVYMLLDRVDEAENQPLPIEVDVREPYKEHAVILRAREALRPLLNNVKLLISLGQEHFKDQLLVEGSFCIDDHRWSETLGEVLVDTRDTVRAVWSEVLQCYAVGSSVVFPQNGGSSVENGGSDEVSEQTGRHSMGDEVKVVAKRSENQVPVCAGSATGAIENSGRTGLYSWNWEFITEDRNYTAYRKPYKDTGFFQYKCIGHYDDITAKDFFEAQVDQKFRKTWDAYAGDIVVMDRDPGSNSRLIHWIMKYPFPMSNREYLFVQRSWISKENDTIVIYNRSASHPDVPDSGNCVRVRDYFSKMVIKSRSEVDKLGMDFELTYFDNPKANLPSSCVNWVAYSAMPDFMEKIHNAALSRQNK